MSTIKCPCCGGEKATQISQREYCCDYCGHTFVHEAPNVGVPPQQYPPQQYPPQQYPPQQYPPQQYPPQQGYSQQGQYQSQNVNPQQNANVAYGKSRITAAVLAIIFGGFGVHRFYLGNIGKGILYLIFCWTYIPSIIGFIEGIIYLFQSDEEFAMKHNRK